MTDGIFTFGAMQVRAGETARQAGVVFGLRVRDGARDRIPGRDESAVNVKIRSLDRVRDAIWTNRRIVPKIPAHHDLFTWPPFLCNADTSSFL
jgi:hypothetical protein